MSKKLIWILGITLVVILFLAACERSAVEPESLATTTGGSGLPTVALPDAYKTQTTSGRYTALALTMMPGAPLATSGTPTSTSYWDATSTSGVTIPTLTGTIGVPSAPTLTPGLPETYTLQKGEFPYCIARRFNIDIDELLAFNGLTKTQLYPEGLELKIPKTGNPLQEPRALKPHPTTYPVAFGDTIYTIACDFGDVDPLYLAAVNGISAPYTLSTGTVLNIP